VCMICINNFPECLSCCTKTQKVCNFVLTNSITKKRKRKKQPMSYLSWINSMVSCFPCVIPQSKEQIKVRLFSIPTTGTGILFNIPPFVKRVFVETWSAGGGGSFLPSDVSVPAIFGAGGGFGSLFSV